MLYFNRYTCTISCNSTQELLHPLYLCEVCNVLLCWHWTKCLNSMFITEDILNVMLHCALLIVCPPDVQNTCQYHAVQYNTTFNCMTWRLKRSAVYTNIHEYLFLFWLLGNVDYLTHFITALLLPQKVNVSPPYEMLNCVIYLLILITMSHYWHVSHKLSASICSLPFRCFCECIFVSTWWRH